MNPSTSNQDHHHDKTTDVERTESSNDATNDTTSATTSYAAITHGSDERDDSWKNLSPLERYENLRLRAQERRKVRSSVNTSTASTASTASIASIVSIAAGASSGDNHNNQDNNQDKNQGKFPPWEYNENEDYDLLKDYYIDRSRRIPKQFTEVHYEKAYASLMNFIQTNHLQQLQDESKSTYVLPTLTEPSTPSHLPIIHAKRTLSPPTSSDDDDGTIASMINHIQPSPELHKPKPLLELVYYELGESYTLPPNKIKEYSERFCDTKLYNPIFNAWKFITIHYQKKMQYTYGKHWKKHEPQYQHYTTSNGMLNDVPQPQTLEQYDCIKDDMNIPIPGRLTSYCESKNLPNVHKKIQYLQQQMKEHNIGPNIVIYNTLLRFWGKRGVIEQMKMIVDEMDHHSSSNTN